VDYALPTKGLELWLGRLAGTWYASWCVRSTLAGALRRFGSAPA